MTTWSSEQIYNGIKGFPAKWICFPLRISLKLLFPTSIDKFEKYKTTTEDLDLF